MHYILYALYWRNALNFNISIEFINTYYNVCIHFKLLFIIANIEHSNNINNSIQFQTLTTFIAYIEHINNFNNSIQCQTTLFPKVY